MEPRYRNSTSGFAFRDIAQLGRSKSTCWVLTKFRRYISIHGWDITSSGYWKQTSAILEFYFWLGFSHLPTISVSFCICLPNLIEIGPPAAELWRLSHFRDGGPGVVMLLSVSFWLRASCIKVEIYTVVSQSTADISLLPVCENERPPYWNSTLGLKYHLCIIIGITFCIGLPNFVQIGPSAAQLWQYIRF